MPAADPPSEPAGRWEFHHLQLYMTVGEIDEKKSFTEYIPAKKKKKKEESSNHEISDSKSK